MVRTRVSRQLDSRFKNQRVQISNSCSASMNFLLMKELRQLFLKLKRLTLFEFLRGSSLTYTKIEGPPVFGNEAGFFL